MSRKRVNRIIFALVLSVIWASLICAAEVTPQVYVDFVGTLDGTAYDLGPREIDTTGTFGAHHGTETVSDGLGALSDADDAAQESFEFDASAFNANGTEFTGTAFVVEAVFTPTDVSDSMAPIIDIGGQAFIRFHSGLSAGNWDGSTDISNNDIQEIPSVGETHHYAIVYDGGTIIDYYMDGVPIFQSDNGSPQGITALISWGNIRHPSVDGGRQLRGQYEAVAFSTFTGTFDPAADFILPEGPMSPALAFAPQPETETVDVLRDTALTWVAGEYAVAHDVYFGTILDDVNDASRANPMDVLVSEGQTDTVFVPATDLEYGQTYYWRIDEVNGAPDNTIHKGELWSFTVEPFAYPIENVVASSNGNAEPGSGPENTVNGSGLNADDQHSSDSGDMWAARPSDSEPLSIQFEFDRIYKLHQMLVWNYNVQFELLLGFGIQNATVEYSLDGENWTVLGDVDLAQATARTDYTYNTVIDFAGAAVKVVRLTINSGFGSMGQYGLSEARFLYIPAHARQSEPADGETEVALDTVLAWRGGREAVTHEVYLSSDAAAVADGTALVDVATESSYAASGLDFGTMYTWKVDEVNEAETVSVWEGSLWSFTTQEYGMVEGFEAYDDDQNRIYDTWVDGWVNQTGSTVGYFDEPFAERVIVNSGRQSLPLAYNNTEAPFYSETSRTWANAQDWTVGGAVSLRLFFHGAADNAAETLYVAVEDAAGHMAVVVNENADAALATEWQAWTVSFDTLADAGVNLAQVETVTVGLGDRANPSAGGEGLIYIDDIAVGSPLTTD